jgi:uncharacterized protein (TIGR00369 family)
MTDLAAKPSLMSIPELDAFLEREFPQIHIHGRLYHIEQVAHGAARVRLTYHDSQLRPGGTLSGPAMMTLADLVFYVAVLASIGPVALAVTTNLNINFLRKPAPRDLIADCRLIKLGRRLAVGEVGIRSDGSPDLVAHVTGTYALPDKA